MTAVGKMGYTLDLVTAGGGTIATEVGLEMVKAMALAMKR